MKEIDKECPSCGNRPKWLWRRFVNAGGHLGFPLICGECGYKSAIAKKKAVVFAYLSYYGYELQDIPEIAPTNERPLCEVCGAEGAELHHYAPVHLFDNADDWPTGYLCVAHHREWHDKIRWHR